MNEPTTLERLQLWRSQDFNALGLGYTAELIYNATIELEKAEAKLRAASRLPSTWRNLKPQTLLERTFLAVYIDCADELQATLDGGYNCALYLEAALLKWTKITEDPDTWPALEQRFVWVSDAGTPSMASWYEGDGDDKVHFGLYWRPICDLDYPPKDES